MSAVIVFDSIVANCTQSIHDEIQKYITLTQFHTYNFLENHVVGVIMLYYSQFLTAAVVLIIDNGERCLRKGVDDVLTTSV